MGQVTIISGVERRRYWSDGQKRALVMAVSQPGANVAGIARQADLRPGQIYRWRRQMFGAAEGFAAVAVQPDPAPPMGPAVVVNWATSRSAWRLIRLLIWLLLSCGHCGGDPVPFGVRIWIATGHTDMRKGMRSLALQIQQSFRRDPMPGISMSFGVAVAICARSCGMRHWHVALCQALGAREVYLAIGYRRRAS